METILSTGLPKYLVNVFFFKILNLKQQIFNNIKEALGRIDE